MLNGADPVKLYDLSCKVGVVYLQCLKLLFISLDSQSGLLNLVTEPDVSTSDYEQDEDVGEELVNSESEQEGSLSDRYQGLLEGCACLAPVYLLEKFSLPLSHNQYFALLKIFFHFLS